MRRPSLPSAPETRHACLRTSGAMSTDLLAIRIDLDPSGADRRRRGV
jgi:hypothetical protein